MPFWFARATVWLLSVTLCLKFFRSMLRDRERDGRMKTVASHVFQLERSVPSIIREAGGNGRAMVGYTDIGHTATAVHRYLKLVALVSKLEPDATSLARRIGEQWSKGASFNGDPVLLLIEGRDALKKGNNAQAAAIARRSLMIQAVCIDTQKLLYDALKAQKEPQTTMPKDIALADLTDKFCERPFTTLVTGNEGRAFVCDCPAYVPVATGNVLHSKNSYEVWNSKAAQEIRRSVLDGDFSYCSRTLCGLIKDDLLPNKADIEDKELRRFIDRRMTKLDVGPRTVQLSHDPSCNLACPSCRNEIITLKRTELDVYEAARDRVIMPLLAKTNGTVMVSGGGDPFASKHYRSILSAIKPEECKDLSIAILTNALVLTPKQWDEFKDAHPLIKSLLVSVDAARPETYADVRRPGRLDKLIPNLEFLAERRKAGDFGLFGLCFVVQDKNFREMPEFVDLGNRLGVDAIWFQRLVNFGTFEEQALRDADVADPNNKHNAEFLQVMQDPRMKHPSVFMFSQFLDR